MVGSSMPDMFVPEWGQTKWSSTLRQTKQPTPWNAWGGEDVDAMYNESKFDRLRTPTATEVRAAEASERLYSNTRHYSEATKRWRSGTQCRTRKRRQKPPRPSRAAPTPGSYGRDPAGSTSGRPLAREEPDGEVWAQNVTNRRPRPRPSSAPAYREAPQLGKQKMRDYGYGIPNWSPYNNSKARCPPPVTASSEYGEFTKHQYLKSLATLLAEHGRKSGAEMKMLLDPSSAMHCAVKEYKKDAIA